MWLAADGVVHTVAVPSDSPLIGRLIELLRSMPLIDREVIDQRLEALEFSIADEIDDSAHGAEAELNFVGRSVPDELLVALPWDRLLGPDMRATFAEVPLRWRLDVVAIASQVIADLGLE